MKGFFWAFAMITGLILPNQAAAATQYEAENATLSGGANKNTNHAGYSGTGFVDGFYNSTTAQVSFAITGATAGSYTVTLHYSAGNGTVTSTGLYVNGTKIRNITCNGTASWDTWADEVETVTLNAGNNTIAYKAETSSGSCINLDYITVTAVSSDPCSGTQGGGGGLKGTTFGLYPPYAAESEYCKATDGDVNTFYDYSQANGGYTGLDLGSARVIGRIRYYPRSTFASRMTGGKFQGSNDGSTYTDLYTISSAPAVQWNDVTISNSTGYRYVRYLSPNNGYANIAEMEFYETQTTYSLALTWDSFGTISPSGTITVNSGAATSISATPSSGYRFSGWTVASGTATIADPNSATTTVTLTNGSATIQANFALILPGLEVTNDGHGTTSPSGSNSVYPGVATPISATPSSGYQFSNWTVTSGTATIANSSSASTTVTLTSGNATIRANFTPITYSLTMSNDGHGSTTPSGTVTVNYGAATSITATPSSGYQFSSWTVTSGTATIANSTSASTTVTLSSGNASIQANFSPITYSLTMSNDGHGSTSPTGTVTVNSGAATSITATPSSGYQFSSWTVASGTATIANSTSASTTVTLSSGNASIQANFSPITYSLTMSNDGHGSTSPTGTVTVNSGAATSITATPSSGYQFSSWTVTSGTATIANSSSASTTVTLSSGNATIRANFTPITYSLTMSNDGHGSTTPTGTVAVNTGAATSISATPSSGYLFSSWTVTSGTATIANSSSASTTVTLSSGNASVQANFTPITYSLTMSNDGHGSTTPTGAVTVNSGVATSISGTPSSGYLFSSWTVTSGTATIANSSSASTTVILSSGNASVQANFTPITYSLTMSNDGHGSTTPTGVVTVNPGVATSISATPASGYLFSSWTVISGTATIANSSSASTTVTLSSGNATIRANFSLQLDTLTVSNNGNGTTVPSGSLVVSSGAPTTITATANSGYHFTSWIVISGTAQIANSTSSSTTVILTAGNASIRANFSQDLPVLPNNRQVSISGTLYDVNGNPVGSPTPQTVEMTVRLYSQATGGDTLYSEDFLIQNNQGVSVNNGLFVVRLGTGVANHDLLSVITTNENIWAEITVLGAQPDVLLPRTPITASPFSISGSH